MTGSWSSKVLATINRYNLQEFDYLPAGSAAKGLLAENPAEKQEDLLLSTMEKKEAPVNFMNQTHVVRKGETLSALAKRYDVSIEELKRRNNLQSSKLSIGQRLLL